MWRRSYGGGSGESVARCALRVAWKDVEFVAIIAPVVLRHDRDLNAVVLQLKAQFFASLDPCHDRSAHPVEEVFSPPLANPCHVERRNCGRQNILESAKIDCRSSEAARGIRGAE